MKCYVLEEYCDVCGNGNKEMSIVAIYNSKEKAEKHCDELQKSLPYNDYYVEVYDID